VNLVMAWDKFWDFQKCLQYILVKFTPSLILLYPSSSILRMVATDLLFHFHMWVHNISTIFNLL
jgi:hypothetical protein